MGVLDQHLLQLGRRDVLTAADDGVVAASADEQITLFVQHGDVFGWEPTVLIEHRADLGVAAGDLLAAHEQLTGLARAEHVAVLVTDLQLDAGHRLSNRSQPLGHGGVLTG